MNIGPQSQDLYRILLSNNNPLSVNELAIKLKVFPQTIYRLVKPLINIGLINKTSDYPCQFVIRPIDEGLSLFLLHQNDWFHRQFSTSGQKKDSFQNNKILKSQEIKISFVQSRDEMFNLSIGEIEKTKTSVDLLRSGNEIPAEVMLALLKAKKRKVLTRMLVQDYTPENANQVSYWQQNGILVKKTALRHIRLMIYDSTVIYFMSYRHTDSNKDLGMKVSYPPFAAMLSQLFDQWWQKADTIRKKK